MTLRRLLLLALALALTLAYGCASNGALQNTNSEAADANLQLGIGYIQTGQVLLARNKLEKALEFDPDLVEAHNALGVIYENARNFRDAERHFRAAVQQQSDYTVARLNLARVLCATGKAKEGEQQYLQLAYDTSYPSVEQPFTGAGICARSRSDLGAAEGYFEKALSANPNAAAALLQLASLNAERKRYQQARDFLQRYHREAGYSPTTLTLAIEIEDQLGDKALSEEYKRLLKAQTAPNA